MTRGHLSERSTGDLIEYGVTATAGELVAADDHRAHLDAVLPGQIQADGSRVARGFARDGWH